MIGGNTDLILKVGTSKTNEIGEDVFDYEVVKIIHGYLDLLSGNSNFSTFNSNFEDSTHLFISDYTPLNFTKKEKKNMIADVNGKQYDVKYIDDAMDLHDHLEIFLKYLE